MTKESPRHRAREYHSQKGFTLIELAISAAIIAIISAIVLIRFDAFDSTIMLKNLAYEVASTIRDAQVYSISVVGGDDAKYRRPYGVSFKEAEPYSYTFFRESAEPVPLFPQYNDAATEKVLSYAIGKNLQIADICVDDDTDDDSTGDCNITQLDISFVRPEFRAKYNADSASISDSDIQSAKIIFSSVRNPSKKWVVEVTTLGQITACNGDEPKCI